MIRYNGFEFPSHAHLEVDTQLIYDDADRVVVAKRHTFIVRSTITTEAPDDCGSIEETMSDLRAKLEESGKGLFVEEVGFGKPFEVNTSGGLRDVMSGPKPRVMRWLPIGSSSVAEIVWQVETVTSPCEDGTSVGLLALNYSISFSINRKGYTTKRVAGHIKIAQSIVAGVSTDSADNYRDKIVVERLTNSQREQDYQLSEDKSRLDFTIVDVENESPNSFPAGVVSISAPTRSRIPFPNPGAVTTQNTFSLNLTLNAQSPRVLAWELLQALFTERIRGYVAAGTPIIITSLDIEEDWFTNDYSFTIQYRITTDFRKFLIDSSFFVAYDVDWNQWSASMTNAQRSRGLGQMAHQRNDANDRLTSLCDQTETTVNAQATEYFRAIQTLAVLCNEQPAPNRSWIKFDAMLVEQTKSGRVFATSVGEVTQSQGELSITEDQNAPLNNYDGEYDQFISETAPMQSWVWKGHAIRVGYPIPPPGRVMIGDATAEIVGNPKVQHRQIGTLFCQPVYESKWSVGYIVENTPAAIEDADVDPSGTNNDNTEPEA